MKELPGHLSDAEVDISLVVPVYNEEDTVETFVEAVVAVLDRTGCSWEIIFVNDGSDDETLSVVRGVMSRIDNVRAIDFSRNFGKEAALTAGLDHSRGSCAIPIDVDLQDPPDVIAQLVEKWQEGYDVVCAVRRSRRTDSFFKSASARLFYRLYNRMSQVEIMNNGGDFRLLDRTVVDVIKQLPERTRFMKGLFAWAGFRTAVVHYERAQRAGGETKFNYWGLWNFAIDGMTSFSTVPLRVWSYVGAAIAFIAFFYASFLVARTIVFGVDVPGYASLMVVVLLLGGIQLITLGIIGEYLGRTYQEVKGRPIYVIRQTLGFEGNQAESATAASGNAADDQIQA